MSYKFILDHKLELENIHDMITIDMKPVTQCAVLKDTIQITGHFGFKGTFLTVELEEDPFEGAIPIDITLPYFGGATDVRLEMVTFDYQVVNKESLTLKFEMIIIGYEAQPQVLDAIVTNHQTYEEEVTIEEIPYSPLIPVTPDKMREEKTDKVNATEDRSEDALVQEALGVTAEEPDIQPEEVPIVDYQSKFIETPVVSDEDFYKRTPEPIPVPEEIPVIPAEEVPEIRVDPQEEQVEFFEEIEEEMVEQPEQIASYVDSVARQFADGQTTVKMVYIRLESELLGEVLERNAATIDDVWNLSKLDDVVHAGDCVMIKYDKSE